MYELQISVVFDHGLLIFFVFFHPQKGKQNAFNLFNVADKFLLLFFRHLVSSFAKANYFLFFDERTLSLSETFPFSFRVHFVCTTLLN